MKDLDLYKFLNGNDIEHSYNGDRLSCWIPFYHLEKFTKMANIDNYGDGYMSGVVLKESCIYIELNDLCDYHGIELSDILQIESK